MTDGPIILYNDEKVDFGETRANLRHSSLADKQNTVDNALIAAQNALAGYVQLTNTPELEQHHQIAQDAFEQVREAIKQSGVRRRQGIVSR